jgi:uncharacterized membrane protein YcaP (DUF421 family)
MFALTLPIAEKMLRPAIVYAFLVVMLRIFGKRELAQLNPFDLVVLLSLSNTVQNAIIGDDNSVSGGLIGAFTLFAVNYLVVRFLFKHRRLDEVLEGKPTCLIEDGCVCRGGLAKDADGIRASHGGASPGLRFARRNPPMHSRARWYVLLCGEGTPPART